MPGNAPESRPSNRRRSRSTGARAWNISYPEELPVSQKREELLEQIRQNQVVIVAGDTGSGKTTQLPKLCLEAGRERIACTQPRRVAAISLSKRVAEELRVRWGQEVGCKVRFMDRSSRDTAVKFLTDGMLLTELQADPMLRRYETIIIDEAHERSLNIDFLLGHLNQLRHRRRDLKIVITSATIDTAAFSRAFDDAPVVEVSGRLFPIELIYSPVDEMLENSGEFTHLDAVAASVERILLESDRGDILAFFATERDIRETTDLLASRKLGPLEIVPLFGRLAAADQQRVFAPSRHRKLVLSTNIAETSLTIPGIRFVIDTGEARISRFNNRTRTRRLPIEAISRSSADQREGRCGRVGPGTCIRLYSEQDYEARMDYTPPEIQRANLADVILRMKAARLGDIERFPFIDPPPGAAIRSGYILLEELGAIEGAGHRMLTRTGQELARLPVDPIVGRMLLQAGEEKCVREVLVIAAALSIQDPRERPADAAAAADQAHRRFVHPDSDFLTLLTIWDTFHDEVEKLSQSRLRKFCGKHFLNYSRVREWRDIHAQLQDALEVGQSERKKRPQPISCNDKDMRFGGIRYRSIHRALLPGLFANVARREEGNLFRAGGDRKVMVFPGSALFDRKARSQRRDRKSRPKGLSPRNPDWIMSGEIVETNRLYARTCARIDPQWILELGAHVCVVSHSAPTFTIESGRVLVRETTRLHGLEVRIRSIGYSQINATHATEIFIREGLLNDELQLRHEFLDHNRRVRDKVEALRTRMRSAHYMDLDEAAFRFYSERLEDVSSVHDLNRFLRSRKKKDPDILKMSEEALVGGLPGDFDRNQFPDTVALENSALPLHYAYRPGRDDDGVTLRLQPAEARHLQPGMLDWLVPGHIAEKVEHLLRGLPKDIRRRLIPISDKASAIARQLKPTHATLVESLASYLQKELGIRTFPTDWKPEAVPDHLRVRVEVVGTDRRPIASGRDVGQVREILVEQEREAARKPKKEVAGAWRRACAQWEREALETWSFDEIPERVSVADDAGLPVYGYPGLRMETTGAALRLFKTPEEARVDLAVGLERFFEYELRYELGWLDRDIKDVAKLGPLIVTLGSLDQIKSDVRELIRRYLCAREVKPLKRQAFQAVAAKAKEQSKGLLWKVLDQLEPLLTKRHELMLKTGEVEWLERELERIVPAGFIRTTPYLRLRDISRYLKALEIRIRKARENPIRDAERSETVTRIASRVSAWVQARQPSPDAIEELGWMLEELRVSLFAQEVGTNGPISEKRIEKRLEALGG